MCACLHVQSGLCSLMKTGVTTWQSPLPFCILLWIYSFITACTCRTLVAGEQASINSEVATGVSIFVTNHLQPFPRFNQWAAGRIADDESPAYDCGECHRVNRAQLFCLPLFDVLRWLSPKSAPASQAKLSQRVHLFFKLNSNPPHHSLS